MLADYGYAAQSIQPALLQVFHVQWERGASPAIQLRTQDPCVPPQVFVGTFVLFAAHLTFYPTLLGIEVCRG